MNARIVNEEYTEWSRTRQYDKVIAKIMSYMYYYSEVNNNNILLKVNDLDSYDTKFVFKIARLCNTTTTIPIYMQMGRRNFKKFVKLNPTEYEVKRARRYEKEKYITLTTDMVKNIAKETFPELYTENLFAKIYQAFWEEDENLKKDEEEVDV